LPSRPDPATRIRLPPLYAILDVETAAARGLDPLEVARAWLDAGVRLIQLRAKAVPFGPFGRLAAAVADLCRSAGCLFVVNDRADVAALSGAAGVHVGQTDLSPEEVRRVIGRQGPGHGVPPGRTPRLVVGLSTHTAGQMMAARAAPIDYVATGPVFATPTKASSWTPLGIAGVRRMVDAAGGLPVVAIGGITLATAPQVLEAGAASVAVIADLLAGAPGVRVREYLRLLG
jgi:thiamine-phosphate diphosphorylase